MKLTPFLISILLLVSCKQKDQEPEITWNSEKSYLMHKKISFDEEIKIRAFLDPKKNWNIQETGSGLRYAILKAGDGPLAMAGQVAGVNYTVKLLDGTVCYQSEKNEIKTFRIDHSDVETGIQEGIKKMHVGDQAVLIIPSHIAHGLLGDNDKIPPLQILVIDIELIALK